jgi:hypothetical protein
LAKAGDVLIELPWPKGPRGGTSWKTVKKMLSEKYHIDIDADGKSDNYGDIFYNQDLRSIMGYVEDWGDPFILIIDARFFAGGTDYEGKWKYDEGFGETYWKNMLDDAISAKLNK